MDRLFHNIMLPPPSEPVPTVGGIPVEELLLAFESEQDELPQPKVESPKRKPKPSLQTKVLGKLGKLVEEAHAAGITIEYTVRRG